MSVQLNDILNFCEELLDSNSMKDASYNGLQVEGATKDINKIVTGVTANIALFNAAHKVNADLVITHHGLYWKGANPTLTGVLGKRVRALGDMSLAAYHLPLDAHPLIGNNALIIKSVGGEIKGYLNNATRDVITMEGYFPIEKSVSQIETELSQKLQRNILVMGPRNRNIKNFAVCTGGGGFVVEEELGANTALITGEVHEQHFHLAEELGITVFVCGHHATEICGISALGQCIGEKFNISQEFINIPSPL